MAENDSNNRPVDSLAYEVQQGDCISKIAADAGLFWETVWNDAKNSELKARRRDPNVLLPGDTVFIPKIRPRVESAGTDARHRFTRRGVPAMLRLQIQKLGIPRANETYTLDIDGRLTTGKLDAKGQLEIAIAPNAYQGRLVVGPDQQTYEFQLGTLDPSDEISGIQARLNNMGYGAGEADGILGPVTRRALRAFQKACVIQETGDADQQTVTKLREAHGS
jgi:hypothetical protein